MNKFVSRLFFRFFVVTLTLSMSCQLSSSVANGQESSGFLQTAITIANPRMVKVYGAGAGMVEGFATGILVSNDGRIITSQGVFLDGRQVKVGLADGSTHQATILKRDRIRQLCLLKIDVETPEFFELTDKQVGDKGDWVVALTNAFKVADKEEPLSATLGVISLRTTMEARLTERDVAYKGELVLIDAITSNPGAAGGAVLNVDGKLVGTVGKIINSSETNTRLNYAVPTSVLKNFIEADSNALASTGTTTNEAKIEVKEVELGIVIFKHGGRGNPAYVDRVKRGSPASKARFRADDMIISIAGNKIGNLRDYDTALKLLRPDEEVLFIVKRGVDIVRLRVTPVAKDK